MARSTDFCFKTTYVCFCAYDWFYLAFNVFRGSSRSGKSSFPWTPCPHPSEITAFEPPLPLGISSDLPLGGGGYGYFVEPHNANTAGYSCLGNEIKYSFYYLLWRSLHSSVCVVISFTMTIHPCVFNMNENSISRRYSQCWWAAEIVSDHYSAYIESIYLNRMKMWCERPHLCNTTRQDASLTGLLHTGFSQKRRSISKRRFGQPFSLPYRWNTFFFLSFQHYIQFLQKANCITEHAGSSHHRNWMYVNNFYL